MGRFAQRAIKTVRLAHDQRDLKVASGIRVSAKRYLHVAGFEVTPSDKVAIEWQGMVTLEAEGTAEGKMELEERLGWGDPRQVRLAPWELVRDKSMAGHVWLRLVHYDARAQAI